MSDPLFEGIAIGSVNLKNRIFMPAMHLNMAKDFQVTDQLIAFYRERAKGGTALISVGYATVDELSGTPLNIGAHNDEYLPGLTALAEAIHEGGAKAAVQLNHAGRYNPSFFLGGRKPVAPSPIASRLTRETPEELDADAIRKIIGRFGDAAERVKKAGYDLVEVLAGTGYLISEFLSPLTNQREDGYGGCLENRMRFGLEVLAEIRSRVGDNYPIMVRLNGNDFMKGGIGPEELMAFAVALEKAGADALCINVGWHEALVPQIVTKVPRGVFAYLARDIKDKVGVPVIASHRINDPDTARQLITENFCDMVAVGRALIADPQFPEKARTAREQEIIHCVACGQGCFDNIFKMKPVQCLCNPRAGHELEKVEKPEAVKKVMVVGGGVAGISAAISAAEAGHAVTLHEQTMRLGGQLHLAGASPGRGEFLVFAEDLAARLNRCDVTVMLGQKVDKQIISQQQPDVLILATGGKPIVARIAGAEQDKVVQAWDVLAQKKETGASVVVIGGGAVGVETALYLAEQGTLSGEELKFLLVSGAVSPEKLYKLATAGSKEVTIVEMVDSLGANFGKSTRWGMLQDVDRFGIKSVVGAKVLEITESGVLVEQGGKQVMLEADTVVVAVGTASDNPVEEIAKELGIACYVVGDARQPATVLEANHQGYRAGIAVGQPVRK
ncbi:oxidoreductase [Desulforhopalus singaporensis]|uniref:2,4-dienoyl-CoA reductase (NADPH2) n=1 Tax=Desulforhopalus singaporensis TaxID=91360 RepID=A0A1H0SRH8_9BACT|nr:FAD-dependent oxidoreductase [Desulforhopalus singaporensis]SDP44351.1 2,4-dienoyl-CoA reductase (NADPH2) [Desulforhopalus singaporensis]